MPNRRAGRATSWVVAAAVALGMVGVSLAQNPPAKTKAPLRTKGRGNAVSKKAHPNAADPLARVAEFQAKGMPQGTYHFTFKLVSYDGTPLAATYYPARLATTAPVVLMVHQKDRSSKDFEEPVSDLKGQGLAEHMQELGYAVLLFDLRGQGANQRRPLTSRDWLTMVDDLQAAYTFLVDRNNRGELNLSKFGVIAVGEGANLAAAWAAQPGAAVSLESRPADLNALILISPLADGEGLLLKTALARIVSRFPTMLMVGDRDVVSADPVKSVKTLVERARLNRVELFPSSLHGYRLLRLEPKATSVLTRFLEGTIKFKAVEWEPRYNLNPVAYDNIQVVKNSKPIEPAAKAKAKEESKPKEKEKEKQKDDAGKK